MNLIEAEIMLNIYTSISLLIFVLLSSALYAIWWKISHIVPNTRLDLNELFHEIFIKIGEVLAARKKWEVDSASKLQEQSVFTVSWKYCF